VSGGLARGELLLLDTNVFVHWARRDDIGVWLDEYYGLAGRAERPLLSTVVEAKVRAIARHANWGERRLRQLAAVFDEMVRVEVDRPPVIEAYAMLYCVARLRGRSIWQKNQNDLWLAATAHATDAVLMTQDADFEFLHPEHIRVERVPQVPR